MELAHRLPVAVIGRMDFDDRAGDTIDPSQHTQHDVAVTRSHSPVFEIGLEALGQSAEWLILHRLRPLEPLMAG